jgi:hypothetical protein
LALAEAVQRCTRCLSAALAIESRVPDRLALLALRTGEKVRAPPLIIHHTRHIIAPILVMTMHDSFPKVYTMQCEITIDAKPSSMPKPPSMRNHHGFETMIDAKPSSMNARVCKNDMCKMNALC